MQSGSKILSQQAREAKFSRQEVCKSLQSGILSRRDAAKFSIARIWAAGLCGLRFRARYKFPIVYILAALRLHPKPPHI